MVAAVIVFILAIFLSLICLDHLRSHQYHYHCITHLCDGDQVVVDNLVIIINSTMSSAT